jgi:Rod binding domain-containing protein
MGPIRDATQAAQAVEACLLRQLIETSGAFKGNGTSGAQIHAQMFVEALANAVEKGGGIGLARLIENSLPATAQEDPPPVDGELMKTPTTALNRYENRADIPVRHSLQRKGH